MLRPVLFSFTFCIVAFAVTDGEDFILGRLYRVQLYHSGNQSHSTFLMTTSYAAISVDYHFTKNLAFSLNNEAVYKETLDPNRSSEVDIVSKTLVKDFRDCKGFVVDWVHDRIYAAKVSGSYIVDILAFGLNSEAQRTVVSWARSSYPNVMKMAVDPYKGNLFWIAKGVIQGVETSGKGLNLSMTDEDITVSALALDLSQRRVYYVGVGRASSLYSMDYTGGEVLKHASSYQFSTVQGLSILRDRIFWVNYTSDSNLLYEGPLNLTGPGDVKSLAALGPDVYDMKILHPSLQEKPLIDPCLDKGCTHSCVAPGGSTATCECPPGLKLLYDGVSCHAIEENYRNGIIFLSTLLVLVVLLACFSLVKVVTKKLPQGLSSVELETF